MTTKHIHHVFAASMLDALSGTGTGIAAGALLASIHIRHRPDALSSLRNLPHVWVTLFPLNGNSLELVAG